MGDKTGISWTDSTWNPIRGCSRVSAGCTGCYAETVANRFKGEGQPYEGLVDHNGRWNGTVRVVESAMDQPLRWQRQRRIFVNSMSDLFHANLAVEDIADVFAIMALAHWHTFQVLTKRSARMREILNDPAFREIVRERWASMALTKNQLDRGHPHHMPWPLPNVYLGVSVEDQRVIHRVADLVETPAVLRFLSCEPLISSVDLSGFLGECRCNVEAMEGAGQHAPSCPATRPRPIGWVIVGGESGANARPMHPDWARSLRDQCQDAGVPFFFKQWGEWVPRMRDDGAPFSTLAAHNRDRLVDSDGDIHCTKEVAGPSAVPMSRVGKHAAGSLLDGVDHKAFPS